MKTLSFPQLVKPYLQIGIPILIVLLLGCGTAYGFYRLGHPNSQEASADTGGGTISISGSLNQVSQPNDTSSGVNFLQGGYSDSSPSASPSPTPSPVSSTAATAAKPNPTAAPKKVAAYAPVTPVPVYFTTPQPVPSYTPSSGYQWVCESDSIGKERLDAQEQSEIAQENASFAAWESGVQSANSGRGVGDSSANETELAQGAEIHQENLQAIQSQHDKAVAALPPYCSYQKTP